eukprot:3399603-Rhodomonas_salina.1
MPDSRRVVPRVLVGPGYAKLALRVAQAAQPDEPGRLEQNKMELRVVPGYPGTRVPGRRTIRPFLYRNILAPATGLGLGVQESRLQSQAEPGYPGYNAPAQTGAGLFLKPPVPGTTTSCPRETCARPAIVGIAAPGNQYSCKKLGSLIVILPVERTEELCKVPMVF